MNKEWRLDGVAVVHILNFTAKILHGDKEHKEWLVKSADEYIRTGNVLPQKDKDTNES